jgi:polyisoprenyl-teichoic acid--peptidoglycan teichoic acid transferase
MSMLLLLLLLVVSGWYVGLPLARAWHDIGRMTSIVAEVEAGAVLPADDLVAVAYVAPTTGPSITLVPVEPTATPSLVPSATLEPSATPTPSVTPTAVPQIVATHRLGAEVADIPTPTPTAPPTSTPVPTPTEPPTATSPPSPTPPPAPTEPPAPTATPQPVIVPTPVPTPPPAIAAAPAAPAPAAPAAAAPAPAPPEASAGGAVTVLILGLDARPGETLSRSDAILLARIDPGRQTMALLSLPRDLWVAIPGYGEGKVNSAYFLGQQSGKGAAVAAATIANTLGIRIDYTATVGFEGFRALVDTLGGIPVDVPRELYDPKYPTEDYGYTTAHFTPGLERMTGARALMYGRIRHPDSDFQRIRRHQALALGIVRQFRERGALQNMQEADKLTAALEPFVRTNLPRAEALQLMWSLRGLDLGSVKRLVVDPAIVHEATIGGAYALVADSAALRGMGAHLVAP